MIRPARSQLGFLRLVVTHYARFRPPRNDANMWSAHKIRFAVSDVVVEVMVNISNTQVSNGGPSFTGLVIDLRRNTDDVLRKMTFLCPPESTTINFVFILLSLRMR